MRAVLVLLVLTPCVILWLVLRAFRQWGREYAQLRRENRRLREDVEILKRATAFFAKETR